MEVCHLRTDKVKFCSQHTRAIVLWSQKLASITVFVLSSFLWHVNFALISVKMQTISQVASMLSNDY